MSAVEDRLAELGLTVPEVATPVAAYVLAVPLCLIAPFFIAGLRVARQTQDRVVLPLTDLPERIARRLPYFKAVILDLPGQRAEGG